MSLLPVDHVCLRAGCPSDPIKAPEMSSAHCPNCHSCMYTVPVDALRKTQEMLAERPGPIADSQDRTARRVNLLRDYCHFASRAAGWWHGADGEHLAEDPMTFAVKLCLIHSEISEAMEGDRKGVPDDKLPHRPMREVELADALIRIFDLAGAYNMDIGGALVEKMAYNNRRADHKPENRQAPGGKAY